MEPQPEKMIEEFTAWLNKLFAENEAAGELRMDPVTRQMFDEEELPPVIASDIINFSGSIIAQRIISLLVDPFHDEGGSTILTGFFSDIGGPWELEFLVAYNDTDYSVVYERK
jgi:hypothetical protein